MMNSGVSDMMFYEESEVNNPFEMHTKRQKNREEIRDMPGRPTRVSSRAEVSSIVLFESYWNIVGISKEQRVNGQPS
jgi:hypothetical protein